LRSEWREEYFLCHECKLFFALGAQEIAKAEQEKAGHNQQKPFCSSHSGFHFCSLYIFRFQQRRAHRQNDQAHPPLKAGATGGTTKAQAVSSRVQRLVVLLL